MNGIVNIRGKEYKTVAHRVNEFRQEHPDWGIHTEALQLGTMVVVKAWITNPEERIIATGLAEEERDSTNINKTSALENCETSAIGRALAALGYAGTEYASANEVSDAIIKQTIKDTTDKMKSMTVPHADAVKRNIENVLAYQQAIANEDYERAVEAWYEINEADRKAITSLAPTSGSFLTTAEREALKSNEFFAARNAIYANNNPEAA